MQNVDAQAARVVTLDGVRHIGTHGADKTDGSDERGYKYLLYVHLPNKQTCYADVAQNTWATFSETPLHLNAGTQLQHVCSKQ